jgi:RNA polymerase sigma-70 factor (ECF subfamily)
VIVIKDTFDKVVAENLPWVLHHVKKKLRNTSLAEDIVQEIFFKAFRAYENYMEEGKIKHWLMRITHNTLCNYFSSQSSNLHSTTLDYVSDDTITFDNQIHVNSPEDIYLQKETIKEILAIVYQLTDKQREVFHYRFVQQYSETEISNLMGIPKGSVKSNTHYAISKIQNKLGISKKNEKRSNVMMKCSEVYEYLFVYANNTFKSEKIEQIKEHLNTCEECNHIVTALRSLIPKMTHSFPDEKSHYLINFPLINLTYCGCSFQMKNITKLNQFLKESNGLIPENETWFSSGFSNHNKLLSMFDDDGNRIEFTVYSEDTAHYRIKATKVISVSSHMWLHQVVLDSSDAFSAKKSIEAPNLYYGSMHNLLGSNAKSALYQAIPRDAENIRIKRGNGVFDCGPYQFAYVDRYVTEEERISLDYSYLLN